MTTRTADILHGWTVQNMMRRDVVTVPDTLTVSGAARILEENEISGAPVLDENDRVLGVVSQSDIVREAAHDGHRSVTEIMMPARFTVRPDTSLAGLARYLVNAGVHRALVMEDDALLGIVTTFDVLHALADSEVSSE